MGRVMRWKDVALDLIIDQLRANSYAPNGHLQFLRTGTSSTHTYGSSSFTLWEWTYTGYLFCLNDNVTWMASLTAEEAFGHVPCGTYWLPGGSFMPELGGHIFKHTHGSLKKFETGVLEIINTGRALSTHFRTERMRVTL